MKNSADFLDYSVDPSGWLKDADDTLAAAAISWPTPASAADVNVAAMTIINGVVMVLISGGQTGGASRLTITLTTGLGRVVDIPVILPISQDQTPAQVPDWPVLDNGAGLAPGALILSDRSVLVDASGNQIVM